jgi:hypothetical protein
VFGKSYELLTAENMNEQLIWSYLISRFGRR